MTPLKEYLKTFLDLPVQEIANLRKLLYQKYYYGLTRNSLYIPMTQSTFYNMVPMIGNINTPSPNTIAEKDAQQINQDNLYQSIILFKLFYGYVPHSVKNLT
jgi:hypothetical protein